MLVKLGIVFVLGLEKNARVDFRVSALCWQSWVVRGGGVFSLLCVGKLVVLVFVECCVSKVGYCVRFLFERQIARVDFWV